MSDEALKILYEKIAKDIVSKADGPYADFRKPFTETWLNVHYAYMGIDRDGQAPKEDWRSRIYPKATKVKCLSAWSQMIQALMGNQQLIDVKPYEESPATLDAAKRQKETIGQQWEQIDLIEKLKIAALDKIVYGNCWFQAPVTDSRTVQRWELDLMGTVTSALAGKPEKKFRAKYAVEDFPNAFNRNVFEMFPYPFAENEQAGDGVIHRALLTEHELMDLARKPGFDADAIREAIKAGPSEVKYDDGYDERAAARGYSSGKRSGFDIIFFSGKYDVSEWAGVVPGFEEVRGYIECMVWVVNAGDSPRVIRALRNPIPGGKRPFLHSVYERVSYELMGVGVGENSLDFNDLIRGSVRLFIDSKKMALPMLGINSKQMATGSKVEFRPFKVFQFASGNPKDLIFPINFPDVSDGLLRLIDLAERYMDEITGLPKWTTGIDSKAYNKTASGLGMLMNAQGQLMRGAIENFDDYIIEPLGSLFYGWNMMYGKDYRAKGDFKIVCNGLSNVMAKDMINQQLMQLLTFVLNPRAMQNPSALRILRMVGANVGIKEVDTILPNPDELEKFQRMTEMQARAELGGMSVPPGAPPLSAALREPPAPMMQSGAPVPAPSAPAAPMGPVAAPGGANG